eukprot:COSAG04_NODE_1240_length_7596_cov_17.241697_1_plen_280_part_00
MERRWALARGVGGGLRTAGVVLQAGGEAVVGRQVGALESLHARPRKRRAEVGVLAGALRDPAPALVTRNVQHRRVGPHEPRGGGLDGGGARGLLCQLRVPGGRLAHRDREDRAHSMPDVGAEDQGDAQAALLDGDLLQLEVDGDARAVVQTADRAFAQRRDGVVPATARAGVVVGARGAREDAQLAHLLLDRHLREQRLDACVTRRRGGLGAAPPQQQECHEKRRRQHHCCLWSREEPAAAKREFRAGRRGSAAAGGGGGGGGGGGATRGGFEFNPSIN